MFADAIRESKNEHQVFFLLTAYVEAVRFGDQLNVLPESVKKLPLSGIGDVRAHLDQLIELDNETVNASASAVIREALPIFSAAVSRLETLGDGTAARPERRKRERRQYASGDMAVSVERRAGPQEDRRRAARA